MEDMEDYLQEGFDPRAVTVPRLRSILVANNVDYPSTAKKGQLVDLVDEYVLPNAPKLRAQRARAKRSSMGIVNAGSAEDTGTWDDSDLAPPPPSTRRSRSPRKASTRIKVEDDERLTPAPRSPTKRSTRSVSRALSHTEELDPHYEAPRSVRRSRKTTTPQIKPDPEEIEQEEVEQPLPPVEEASVFTYDNPFQSGSSPPQAKTPSNRRRTTGGDPVKSAKTTTRRRTDGYTPEPKKRLDVTPPQKRRLATPEYLMEPGEEFTPDEQLELEEAAYRGEIKVALRKPAGRVARKSSGTTPLLVLFLTLVGVYLSWYRQEKIAVGYCGRGRPEKEIVFMDVPVPDALLPFIEPRCEACPQHAYCYEDFSARCEQDFVLKPHPLSLGGLVPLPPTCEPDGEKARRVQAVADRAIEELRERRAKFECGELVNEETGQHEETPAIPEEELKATVSRKRSKRLNSEEFDDLWAAAMGEVTSRDEVEVIETTTPSGSPDLSKRRLSSTSLARLPLTCGFKRSIRLGLARYRFTIVVLITSVLVVFYCRARYRKHRYIAGRTPEVVNVVLDRLAKHKEQFDEEVEDPWLFLPNLRDDILRAVHSAADRERIWQRAKLVVEQNSNVRASQREGRRGEIGRAWEWIGPVDVENARRWRSGRVSLGADTKSPLKSESPNMKTTPEVKRWEDPRPIY